MIHCGFTDPLKLPCLTKHSYCVCQDLSKNIQCSWSNNKAPFVSLPGFYPHFVPPHPTCTSSKDLWSCLYTEPTWPNERVGMLSYIHSSVSSAVCFQAILNSDETTHVLENLDPDTEYAVTVTAIYPDESESEDLMGSEKTCKPAARSPPSTTTPHKTRAKPTTKSKHHVFHWQTWLWNNSVVLSTSLSSVEGSGGYVSCVSSDRDRFLFTVDECVWTMRDSVDRSTLWLFFSFLPACLCIFSASLLRSHHKTPAKDFTEHQVHAQ